MRSASFVLVLGLALVATPALADKRFLHGKAVFVDEQDRQTPAVGLDIVCEETGTSETTDAGGLFRVFLPDVLLPGDRIRLQVQRTDWRIWQPSAGEVTIPASPHEKKAVTVKLLEVGAKRLLSEAAIEQLLLDAARKSKEQVKADGRPAEIQLSRYVGEWAVQHGFAPEEVQAQVDQWIAKVEGKGDDLRRLALAEFAKSNFDRASDLAAEWAAYGDRSRHAVEKAKQRPRGDAVQAYRLAADARYNDYRFENALEFYRKALAVSSRKQAPTTWAAMQDDLGKAARELGVRAQGGAARQYLDQSIAAHRAALQVRTRELPQQWAESQSSLGLALQEQGSRSPGEAARALLAQAVDAYRAALEVYTRQRTPQQWATIQNKLGTALQDQANRSSGEAGRALLAQAAEAYRAALEVYTRERTPQQFAVIQNNLGTALEEQGERSPGEAGRMLRAQAAEAYSAAVEVSTRTSPWLLQYHTDSSEPTAGF
jgi:tetratricopeptide (TPR) repeat protein